MQPTSTAVGSAVGGDWYDAFLLPDGTTTLVIGGVTGHDQTATAAMAQVRNVLRGIAQTLDRTPAGVLAALDGALAGLGVSTLATAVLCQILLGARPSARRSDHDLALAPGSTLVLRSGDPPERRLGGRRILGGRGTRSDGGSDGPGGVRR